MIQQNNTFTSYYSCHHLSFPLQQLIHLYQQCYYLRVVFTSHYQAGIEISSQQNFSGDSQDSRGYTSISVREPLAAIKAQTQAAAAANTQAQGGQPGEGEG